MRDRSSSKKNEAKLKAYLSKINSGKKSEASENKKGITGTNRKPLKK